MPVLTDPSCADGGGMDVRDWLRELDEPIYAWRQAHLVGAAEES